MPAIFATMAIVAFGALINLIGQNLSPDTTTIIWVNAATGNDGNSGKAS